jgi:hypothetical protein
MSWSWTVPDHGLQCLQDRADSSTTARRTRRSKQSRPQRASLEPKTSSEAIEQGLAALEQDQYESAIESFTVALTLPGKGYHSAQGARSCHSSL